MPHVRHITECPANSHDYKYELVLFSSKLSFKSVSPALLLPYHEVACKLASADQKNP